MIGNYVHSTMCDETIQISALMESMDLAVIPIILDNEWLLNLGAIARFQNTEFMYNRFRLIWKESHEYWYIVDADSLCYLTKIEFVHEWQNFVFILNGNKLTLKQK